MADVLGRSRTLAAKFAPVLGVAVLFLALWAGAVKAFDIPRYLLPSPADIFNEFTSHADIYLHHGLVTLLESVLGFLIGATIGFLLAVLLDTSRLLERSLMPYLIMATNIPIVAFAPVVVIYVGYGMASKVVVAAFLTFFPVVINTLKGLKSCDAVHQDLFHVLSASRWQRLVRLKLPSSMPFVFSALKLGATASVLAAVVAEFIQAAQGLGWLILTSAYTNNMTRVWSTVVVSAAIAVAFYSIVVVAERLLVPWHSSMIGADK